MNSLSSGHWFIHASFVPICFDFAYGIFVDQVYGTGNESAEGRTNAICPQISREIFTLICNTLQVGDLVNGLHYGDSRIEAWPYNFSKVDDGIKPDAN